MSDNGFEQASNLPDGVETRNFREFRVERQEDEGESVTIEGHAATFEDPYRVGDFMEQVAPGAFTESIETDDVRALLNHNPDHVLGRNRAGTLRLEEDDVGLRSEIDLPTSRDDIREAVERGDISQMSFGFEVLAERWEDQEDHELRTIERAKLWDVSPVTYPANPATDVALASRAEWRSKQAESEEPEEEAATDEEPEAREDGGCGCGESSDEEPAEEETQEGEDEERDVPADATYRLADLRARAGKRREGSVNVSGGGDVDGETEKSATGSVSVQGGG